MRIALEGGDLGNSPEEKTADEKAARGLVGGKEARSEAREAGESEAAALEKAAVKSRLLHVGVKTGVTSIWSGGGVLA